MAHPTGGRKRLRRSSTILNCKRKNIKGVILILVHFQLTHLNLKKSTKGTVTAQHGNAPALTDVEAGCGRLHLQRRPQGPEG